MGTVRDKERIARELTAIVGADGVVVEPGELRVYENGLLIVDARVVLSTEERGRSR